jgi:hypothetical protein
VDYLLIAGIIAVPILLIALFWAGVRSGTKSKDQQSWLDYGNFFIVATGLAAGLLGFLIVLLFLGRFTDTAQGLGFLTALFGVITGLVGTYFGVKQSSDAREGAEQLALGANTAPTISITPATDRKVPSATHKVTATVISVDGSSAAKIPVTSGSPTDRTRMPRTR